MKQEPRDPNALCGALPLLPSFSSWDLPRAPSLHSLLPDLPKGFVLASLWASCKPRVSAHPLC